MEKPQIDNNKILPSNDVESVEIEVIHDYSKRAQWLRAAVLGANDGLLSTASLMMGIGAVCRDAKTMILTGIAGLVAGACSMAIGEFVSVYSQPDIEVAQIEREKKVHANANGGGGRVGLSFRGGGGGASGGGSVCEGLPCEAGGGSGGGEHGASRVWMGGGGAREGAASEGLGEGASWRLAGYGDHFLFTKLIGSTGV